MVDAVNHAAGTWWMYMLHATWQASLVAGLFLAAACLARLGPDPGGTRRPAASPPQENGAAPEGVARTGSVRRLRAIPGRHAPASFRSRRGVLCVRRIP